MLLFRGILLAIFAFSACSAEGNPVYVNPPPPPVQATNAPSGGFVTQTVYGFLDFTTTIGNTVMIFSPQSAPPPEPPKPKSEPKVVVNVIETKPNAPKVEKLDIQPSKTITKSTQKPKLSSVVQVVAAPSEIQNSPKVHVIASKVDVVTSAHEKKQIYSQVEVKQESPMVVQAVSEPNQVFSSKVEIRSSDPEPAYQVGNQIAEPEYDFLSRQPSEYAEETFRVINLKPTAKLSNRRATHDARRGQSTTAKEARPTGLVTKLSGSVVRDGVTTIHETSVIGTYISGKYAQVLQSSSHIVSSAKGNKGRISPSSTLRILKTAAPTTPASRHHIDPSPQHNTETAPLPEQHGPSGPNHVRASRRPATLSGSFKNRLRNRESEYHEPQTTPSNVVTPQTTTTKKSSRGRGKTKNRRNRRKNSTKKNKKNKNRTKNSSNSTSTSTSTSNSISSKKRVEIATVSAKFKPTIASYSSRRTNKATTRSSSFKQTTTTTTPAPTTETFSNRRFKPKVQATPPVSDADSSSSLYKFKLNRTPGRWQYKTTAKPRVTIRKSAGEESGGAVTPPTTNLEVITNDIPSSSSRQEENDLESSGSINGNVVNEADTADNALEKKYPVETINVEISTPADFKNVYYELATIKSPYTFQVGTVKNTRYITVTSTFEKSLEPEPTATASLNEPLTENILAPSTHIDKEHNLLDSSIATLPPLYLSSDGETPPLETLTETFSTTQQMLKTHILPVIREGANASSLTLIQTYHITRLVTATKTLPPMDAYQFVPSKRLKEFNSKLDEAGSELHLELDFGEDDEDDEDTHSRKLPADLDLANIGTDFDLFDVDRTKLEGQARSKKKAQRLVTELPPPPQAQSFSPEHLQQLAFLRLINPAAAAQIPQIPQVITTSKPIVTLETVYESRVIPVVNGALTSYSTISRPVGTVSKTEFEIGTSMLPGLPIPQVPVNPLFPQAQPQFQITTAPVVTQTVVTQTESKVLKLTFGAKTAYTTLFSTNIVPTLLTTYVTTSIPVQQTAAFPGFYQPYGPFPFVG